MPAFGRTKKAKSDSMIIDAGEKIKPIVKDKLVKALDYAVIAAITAAIAFYATRC